VVTTVVAPASQVADEDQAGRVDRRRGGWRHGRKL